MSQERSCVSLANADTKIQAGVSVSFVAGTIGGLLYAYGSFTSQPSAFYMFSGVIWFGTAAAGACFAAVGVAQKTYQACRSQSFWSEPNLADAPDRPEPNNVFLLTPDEQVRRLM